MQVSEERAGWSGDWIPVKARFSAPVQNGPEAQLTSHTIVTGSLRGVNRPGSDVDHPTVSSAEVKERVELYICPLSLSFWAFVAFLWCFTFTFTYPRCADERHSLEKGPYLKLVTHHFVLDTTTKYKTMFLLSLLRPSTLTQCTVTHTELHTSDFTELFVYEAVICRGDEQL